MWRAVVLQHEEHEEAGLLGPALTEAGFTLVRRFRDVQHADLEAELVVVLGGSMGVGDTAQHPFLAKEQAFLAERLALERPSLGICLGAQLLAAAAGSEVFNGKNGFEVGVAPVRWTKAGLEDPVLAGLSTKLTVAHWHQDTWSPVRGAQLLGSTDRYTQQAFRLGSTYAFQFHPELAAAAWLRWVEGGTQTLTAAGKDVAALKAEAGKLKAAEPQLVRLCEQLAHHFAACAG
jgi:GMP synthase (glutamine-hydrolysing)